MICTKRSPMLNRLAIATAGFALLSSHAAIVAGQVSGLPSVPGLTELQQPVADTFQSVCVAITGPGGVTPKPSGTPVERLASSCTKMVASALNNQPSGNPFPPEFNLMISNEQIATGVQAKAKSIENDRQHGRRIERNAMLGETARDMGVMVRDPDEQALDTWRDAGATRLIVAPWARSTDAVDGLAAFRPVQ